MSQEFACGHCSENFFDEEVKEGKCPFCGSTEVLSCEPLDLSEDMDGDHDSAMSSVGWGDDDSLAYGGVCDDDYCLDFDE